jgi:hypothetical protein
VIPTGDPAGKSEAQNRAAAVRAGLGNAPPTDYYRFQEKEFSPQIPQITQIKAVSRVIREICGKSFS